MARLFRLEAARGASPVFLVLCGMAMMTVFPNQHAFAQMQGAPIAGESGKAQSGGQTPTGRQVEEAPYPGGPGRRVEEAPRPGTLGSTEELQRLKGSPATAGSGSSTDQPAR
jgi:hypothetical protein